MAVAHSTVVFDVKDFKVYPLSSDTGASPTYGSAVDVPGIANVTMNPNFITAELKGDSVVLAQKSRIDRMNLSATYGRLSLDVLKVLFGGTLTEGASDAEYNLAGTVTVPYFKAAFQIDDTELGTSNNGSVQVTLYKCTVTGGGLLNQQTDQFGQPTMDIQAIPSAGSAQVFMTVKFFDTTQTLS